MTAYYNEHDPYAAQWLRNLISAGHIAPGEVDERDIQNVSADELVGFTQCHFFAGIGGWSLALRLAGWTDGRPCWTGSCPCQPFSAAGKGKAFADDRHLWPQWMALIRECRPATVFGEQVEAAIGWGWLDAVFSDLEGEGYACGAAVLPACSVGAPHIRQRLWFVADAARGDQRRYGGEPRGATGARSGEAWPADGNSARSASAMGDGRLVHAPSEQVGRGRARFSGSAAGELADSIGAGLEGIDTRTLGNECAPAERSGAAIGMAHANGRNASAEGLQRGGEYGQQPEDGRSGPWDQLEWLPCRDGKLRPTRPGLFPLAHGVPARVGKLRAAGNAIVPALAAEFIRAFINRNGPG